MRPLAWLVPLLAASCCLRAQSSSFQPAFQQTAVATACQTQGRFQFEDDFVLGDFNGDGKTDVAILCADGLQISILLGNGDGTFRTPVVTSIPNPGALELEGLQAGDVNGDGKTDLIFVNQKGPQVTFPHCGLGTESGPSWTIFELLSNGDGTFAPPITVATSLIYTPLALTDMDGDGILDLVLDSKGLNGAGIMFGKKDGTFAALIPIAGPANPGQANQCWDVAHVADLNGDGKPDLVIRSNITDQSSGVGIMLNQGSGSFGTPVLIANAAPSFFSVVTADFAGDGKVDIGVFNGGSVASPLQIFLGNGDGSFQASPPVAILVGVLSAADMNGDGKADLVQVNANSDVVIYLSNGDGTFQTLPPIPTNPAIQLATPVDFNGDGKPDLAGFLSSSYVVGAPVTLGVLINTTVLAATTGAANGASFVAGEPLTAGALASIFGNGFASSNFYAAAIPLPTTLGNASVTIGGFPAPLLFVSSKQINLQVPWEVSGLTADIVVTVDGSALAPFQAHIGPVSPGVFTAQSGIGQAIAINPDGSLAGPEGSIPGTALHPAKVGEALVILATGLGPVTPKIADGHNASDALRDTLATPKVLIGGEPAVVSFSGLSPQFVGLNQINVTVPQVQAGVVPLQISIGGVTTSNQVTIAVQ
jgi:uncharacterized protein (TIGR03437 family)